MPTWIGSFQSNGSPVVSITISGPFPQAAQTFEAIIDTGFTGFLSMSWDKAFPLGLALIGTTNVVLANGAISPKLMTLGSVIVGTEVETGVVLLDQAGDTLIGTEFLRKFRKQLVVSQQQNQVELRDDPPPTVPAVPTAPAVPPAPAIP